jgi:hypothetical protein
MEVDSMHVLPRDLRANAVITSLPEDDSIYSYWDKKYVLSLTEPTGSLFSHIVELLS